MDAITQDDCPFELPAPREVADRCMARAWDDDTDDVSRATLEQAALTITHLADRCLELAAAMERGSLRRDGA